MLIETLKAILFGIIEGITEWLPISSTGHLILLDEFLKLNMSTQFMSMFEVVIQFGAILAVLVLYFPRLWPFRSPLSQRGWIKTRTMRMWMVILVAVLPSALIGLPLDNLLEATLQTPLIVAAMLIVYGVLFIVAERHVIRGKRPVINRVSEIDLRTALYFGLFQILALIPGTSRSGATILGGILLGCSRACAAEFSFFMAVPTMFGASLLRMMKYGFRMTGQEMLILLSGCVTAFVVSVMVIRTLMAYVKRQNFEIFGWYRIALGILVVVYTLAKGLG